MQQVAEKKPGNLRFCHENADVRGRKGLEEYQGQKTETYRGKKTETYRGQKTETYRGKKAEISIAVGQTRG